MNDITTIETKLAAGRCPDCNSDAWRLGPRGGASRNIECSQCRNRFNVALFFGRLVFAERIPSESEGGSLWREDWFPR